MKSGGLPECRFRKRYETLWWWTLEFFCFARHYLMLHGAKGAGRVQTNGPGETDEDSNQIVARTSYGNNAAGRNRCCYDQCVRSIEEVKIDGAKEEKQFVQVDSEK